MIVILGAGLAGMSTALHLDSLPWRIYEAEQEVGGLCRSIQEEGFTFDYTGHLLYLHHDPVKALFRKLMQGKMHALNRSAWIHSHGADVPFPFQVNTFGLPEAVRAECVAGFEKAEAARRASPVKEELAVRSEVLDFLELKLVKDRSESDMEQWVMRTFGPGFAKHFFRPYNEKFWRRPLKEMTAEWAAWSIPVPNLEEVQRGARGEAGRHFGYNTSILYPREGGIRVLPDALHHALGSGAAMGPGSGEMGGQGSEPLIRLGKRAAAVNAGSRTIRFEDGEEAPFEWLVTSIPLDRLVAMIEDAPEEIRHAGASLKSVAVYGVNVGIKGGLGHHSHWTYFPGKDYLFYRLGYPSNYAPTMAPAGHASITAEITRREDEEPVKDLVGRVVNDLVRSGAVKQAGDVVFTQTMRLDPAYVIFDQARQAALPALYDYLMRHRIMPVGRYGTWNYMGMEDSILHGIQAAGFLKGRAAAGG